ncbi:uncharacterized protein LOC133195232 [Saccostrea echinata]|uniref:uncharacterized protein LOC133195232 n=1 Tax=Saccostrea echinata TaxID=191078 RepID=UPI002A8046F6|nr:uncharacterized protein LOC133195232 [Saccostrea echinata]
MLKLLNHPGLTHYRILIMDTSSSAELDGGGIATPSMSSAHGYAFVPSLHLMTEVEAPRSGTSISVYSNPIIGTSPAVMGYSFVPPFHLIQEVDSKPNTSGKSSTPKASSGMLMEKTFYKNISNTLPIKIKQISYNSDELETPRNGSLSQMYRKTHRMHQEFENWNRDIAKQVDHWMKDKPVQSGFYSSLSTQRVPRFSNSNIVKRKKLQKKRLKIKDLDDKKTSRASTVRGSDSDFSVDSETFRSRRSNNGRPPLSKSFPSSKDAPDDETSVFGSIHNEIEFKKRYRRMFDLNKHLQFVNSTNGLMGKKIFKKTHHLPPMNRQLQEARKPQKLECSELFAITTVQQSNDPSEITTPSTQKVFTSTETSELSDNSGFGQSQPSSREINTISGKKAVEAEKHSNFLRQTNKPSKPEVFKFGKLPKISNNKEMNSDKDRYSSKDSMDSKSITTRLNDSLQKCASWVSETDSVNGEYAEVREMKVTINIKYKSAEKGKMITNESSGIIKDTAVNLTPFDKTKNMTEITEHEHFPGMLSE